MHRSSSRPFTNRKFCRSTVARCRSARWRHLPHCPSQPSHRLALIVLSGCLGQVFPTQNRLGMVASVLLLQPSGRTLRRYVDDGRQVCWVEQPILQSQSCSPAGRNARVCSARNRALLPRLGRGWCDSHGPVASVLSGRLASCCGWVSDRLLTVLAMRTHLDPVTMDRPPWPVEYAGYGAVRAMGIVVPALLCKLAGSYLLA